MTNVVALPHMCGAIRVIDVYVQIRRVQAGQFVELADIIPLLGVILINA
jgi:hypothetical protein